MGLKEFLKWAVLQPGHAGRADSVGPSARRVLLEHELATEDETGGASTLTLTAKGVRQGKFWLERPETVYWMLDTTEGGTGIFHACASYGDALECKPALCGLQMVEASDFTRPRGDDKCPTCARVERERIAAGLSRAG